MRHCTLLAVVALGCGLPAPVEPLARTPDAPFRQQAPAPSATRNFVRAPPIHIERLENGLVVVAVPRFDLPLVTAELVVRGAGFGAIPSEPGVALVTAHAIAEPPEQVIFTRVQREFAFIASVARREGFETISRVLAQSTRKPDLDAATLAIAKTYVVESNDDAIVESLTNEHLYVTPPPLLTNAVDSISLDDVTTFHRKHYRPERAAFVVVGSVEPEAAFAAARASLGDWLAAEPAPDEREPGIPSLMPKIGLRPIVALHRELPFAYARITIPGPPIVHTDFPAFELTATVLGGSVSSRGFKTLRIHDASSYAVSAEITPHPNGSELVLQFSTDPTMLADGIRRMLAEIEHLRHEELTLHDFEGIKAIRQANLATSLVSNAGTAMLLASHFALGNDPARFSNYLASIDAVEPSDLSRAARAWLTVERIQVLVAVSHRNVLVPLERLGKVLWQGPR